MSARSPIAPAAALAFLLAFPPPGGAQGGPTCPAIQPGCATVFGAKGRLLDPKPGVPGYEFKRKLDLSAKEKPSGDTLAGDPVTTGAFVQVLVFGLGGLQTQCVQIPSGIDRWYVKDYGTLAYFRYRVPSGSGPVRGLALKSYPGLYFAISLKMDARYAPLDLVPPAPGSYLGAVITFPGGGQYAVNLGGTTGGIFAQNDAKALKIKTPKPPLGNEGSCPDASAVCGDGTIDAPFETCEAGNPSSLCSDAFCGANGLPCLCPYCGDAVASANPPGSTPELEACDRGDPQSCSEGCRNDCQCATCGDGVLDLPIEECDGAETDYCDYLGTSCIQSDGDPERHPAECRCEGVCGDGYVNQFSEICDTWDNLACASGGCIPAGFPGACTCAYCGDDVRDTDAEECDGTDTGYCDPGVACGAPGGPFECKCGTCGDGVINTPDETCDGGALGPCTACRADCGCCGDGVVNGPEECESDADCGGGDTCDTATCACQ